MLVSNLTGMKDISHFSLNEVAALVDMPVRTVRYYIQLGLVDRPEGSNRGAFYDDRHVVQLMTIRKWKDAGLSLERIQDILRQSGGDVPVPPLPRKKPGDVEVWSRIHIKDGVELNLEPHLAELSPEQVRWLCQEIAKLVTTTPKEEE